MLDGETATPAVLSFLRGSKVGQVVTLPPQGEERGGREEVGDEVEVERGEGGPVLRHLLPATKKAYLCDTRRYW